ncbi:MAG: CFI-box-CTERM domain-containing protein [Bacteriovoracaceae bacterium]
MATARASKDKPAQMDPKERRKIEMINKKMMQRFSFVKNGKEAVKKNDFVGAIKNYNSYFSIIAEAKDTSIDKLTPEMFDKKKDLSEMLLISQIYWDLAKIFDRSPKTLNEFKKNLDKFVLFTKGQPFQVVNSQVIKRFIENKKMFHKEEFKSAYSQLGLLSKGCYVATYCYGEEHAITNQFREFRDRLIDQDRGIRFIHTYYKYSPMIVAYFYKHPVLGQIITRLAVRPLLLSIYFIIKCGWKTK